MESVTAAVEDENPEEKASETAPENLEVRFTFLMSCLKNKNLFNWSKKTPAQHGMFAGMSSFFLQTYLKILNVSFVIFSIIFNTLCFLLEA